MHLGESGIEQVDAIRCIADGPPATQGAVHSWYDVWTAGGPAALLATS